MPDIVSHIHNPWPKDLANTIAGRLTLFDEDEPERIREIIEVSLRRRFDYYKTPNLKGIAGQEFRSCLQSRLGKIDPHSEGYKEAEVYKQRDLSIKYHWGHNHDFGDFYLPGRMGDRHIDVMADFCTFFPILPEDFRGKDVFDIGCWTGGTSLLLAALGSNVVAIEEVSKYAKTVRFLAESFGMEERVKVVSSSLYACNAEDFHNRFDIAYMPGVIYHLSDPLIALRILYNALRLGGVILLEAAGINIEEPYCRFEGSHVYGTGEKENLDRSGWNWFLPSPSALYRMLKEAGFSEIETLFFTGTDRVYGYARKSSEIPVCRAGLSAPEIK